MPSTFDSLIGSREVARGVYVYVYRGDASGDALYRALKGTARPLVVNFSPDIFAREKFGPEIAVEPYERYLATEELHGLLATAYRLALEWYHGLPEDAHIYDGISLAAVAAYDFVTVKRPADGLPGWRIDEVIGRRVRFDIAADQPIMLEMLE